METIDSTEWSMEWWCNNCGGMGDVPTNGLNLEEAICIVCSHCSHPTLYAWCEKCGAGMEHEEIDLTDHPKTWVCSDCNTEYRFQSLFYQRPVYFKPSEFSELVYVNEIDFRKYEHVIIPKLREIIFSWDKFRRKTLFISVIFLVFGGILFSVSASIKPLHFLGRFALVWMAVYFFAILVDIIFWLISKVFQLVYKIRKTQE